MAEPHARVRMGLAILAVAGLAAQANARPVDILTYHYDNFRTGWNQHEKKLTARNVAGNRFGLITSTVLDEQVDAQPLILGNQSVNGNSAREVVYIATEGDTVYAIDANTGDILLQRNLGTPVSRNSLPGGCTNGGPNLGINATPTIDPVTHTIYLITYTRETNKPVYRVHALDPSTLADITPSVVITASGKLSDGSTYNFDPHESRNRAGLLLANGNLYAGFASFCDFDANKSRGWVLGWQKDTLTPLAHNEMTNVLSSSPDDFFLSSIWMSGYGLAANPTTGDIYFVTGNSDYSGTTLDPEKNIAESAVQMSTDLSTVKSLFTPPNGVELENYDIDYGSGGFLLLPPQPNQPFDLGAAAGKDGNLYFFNADNLGTGMSNTNIGTYDIHGGCWCGQSYYTAADGTGRVVTSGGNTTQVWKVKTGAHPKLVPLAAMADIGGGQDPGFFTSISSNGTDDKTAVVWALSHADGSPQHNVSLYAFNARKGNTLFSGHAGQWPNTDGNANLVPTVANGKVYVAAYQTLDIFGLSSAAAAKQAAVSYSPAAMQVALPAGTHEIFGIVKAMNGNKFVVQRRDGSTIRVDASVAESTWRYAEPAPGHGVLMRGSFDRDGLLHADIVLHAKKNAAMWRADR